MTRPLSATTGARLGLLTTLLATSGCTGPNDRTTVSFPFELRALAQGTSPEGPLRCGASFVVERARSVTAPQGERRWIGDAGGDMGLATISPDGRVSEAVADWAGTARVRVMGDSIEVRFEVGGYYKGDGVTFVGRFDEDGAAGQWACPGTRFRSFDPLVLDTLPGIHGPWRLRPI